ncbi:MAG: ABC transporter ATP-binding protein [Hyphomicrobiaceae bacterium]|nr:ABC transporter ATP-binding protein [Hyphomicrobiaceae bacterium]
MPRGRNQEPAESETGHPPRAGAAFSASLAFENVERRYGEVSALAGVTLAIEPGEVVCLLGPSGCGKTTLLRIASGIEKPSAGRVLIAGSEVAGPSRFVPPEARHVGLMFQDFALFPHLTILDNVAFGLKSLPKADATREARAVLARVGMLRHADKYPHMLSGGEQQRVALARAIVPRPAVMLMDEPFSGLDVHLRERLQEETLSLLRETRATSIIVTHHPEEAMRLADRIAVMRRGRLVQMGRARDLHRNPVDLFVARLFSEINEIPWSVEGGALRTPVGTFIVPEFVEGDRAVVCVRQRAIEVAPQGEGLPARIVRVKPLGDAALVDLAVEGFDTLLRARIRESELPQSADVGVRIEPERVLVFPVDDGDDDGVSGDPHEQPS